MLMKTASSGRESICSAPEIYPTNFDLKPVGSGPNRLPQSSFHPANDVLMAKIVAAVVNLQVAFRDRDGSKPGALVVANDVPGKSCFPQ